MRRLALLLVSMSTACVALPALAGPYSDALGGCLADHTTGKDRKDLARWIFVAMAAHPDMHPLTTITPQIRDDADRMAGQMFQRLLTDDCAKETRAATKNEGPQAIEQSFETLGKLAMQELMTNAAVRDELGGISRYVDRNKLEKVLGPK